MSKELVSVIQVRYTLEGFEIRSFDPRWQGKIQEFKSLVQQLMRAISQRQGLSIGIEEYEAFATDFGAIDFRKFEEETPLTESETKLLERIQGLRSEFINGNYVQTNLDEEVEDEFSDEQNQTFLG